MRQRSDYPTFSDQEMARRHKATEALMEQEGEWLLSWFTAPAGMLPTFIG